MKVLDRQDIRDFYSPGMVVIEKWQDRITLANPGTIIVGKKQMLRGGESKPRNKGLMKMFNLLGIGEHAGSGVPDIYSAWREAGLKEPLLAEGKIVMTNPDSPNSPRQKYISVT